MYCQFRLEIDQFVEKLEDIINTYRNRNIIVTVDANAKSPLWYSNIANDRDRRRGELMEDLIQANNLIICNTEGQSPTYRNRASAETNIDITLTSLNLLNDIQNWQVLDGQTSSDHNIIKFEIRQNKNAAQSTAMEQVRPVYNLMKMDWKKMEEILTSPEETEGINLDQLVEEVERRTEYAIGRACPTSKKNKNKSRTPFWCGEMDRLRRIVRSRRKSYQQARDPALRNRKLEQYRDAKKEYKEKNNK